MALVLIVDDDVSITTSVALLLKQAGHASQAAAGPKEALSLLERGGFGLVLQDMNFSRQTTGAEGLALLADVKARWPQLPVVLMTAWGSIGLAVLGMKSGASDFVTKPWTNAQLLQSIETALGLQEARGGRERPLPTRDELDTAYDFSGIGRLTDEINRDFLVPVYPAQAMKAMSGAAARYPVTQRGQHPLE